MGTPSGRHWTHWNTEGTGRVRLKQHENNGASQHCQKGQRQRRDPEYGHQIGVRGEQDVAEQIVIDVDVNRGELEQQQAGGEGCSEQDRPG